jgi:hypothetical protein
MIRIFKTEAKITGSPAILPYGCSGPLYLPGLNLHCVENSAYAQSSGREEATTMCIP